MLLVLDGYPFPLGKLGKVRVRAFSSESAVANTAKGNMRFILNRGSVDMHHSRLEFIGESHGLAEVAGVDRSTQTMT